MKKITILLTLILTCSLFMGCNKTANSTFNGTYWTDNPINQEVEKGFYERVEYSVTAIEKDGDRAPALSEINTDYLNFIVDPYNSSYVTEIEEKDGLYVYRTKLVICGEYTYGEDGSYLVEGDVTETETSFKGMKEGFACVKSVKRVKNTYPTEQAPKDDTAFVTVSADFTVDYTDKKATLTVTPRDEISKTYLSSVDEPVTVKKYNKNAYIDNELMLLMFRNFQYDKSLSYTFSTIESASGTLKGIVGSAKTSTAVSQTSEDELSANQTIDITCNIDGSMMKRSFNAFGVTFKTTGEFAQSFAHVYYAKSIGDDTTDAQNDSRHYMVKCYRPMIYNTGYLVYTIKTVSHVKTVNA